MQTSKRTDDPQVARSKDNDNQSTGCTQQLLQQSFALEPRTMTETDEIMNGSAPIHAGRFERCKHMHDNKTISCTGGGDGTIHAELNGTDINAAACLAVQRYENTSRR